MTPTNPNGHSDRASPSAQIILEDRDGVAVGMVTSSVQGALSEDVSWVLGLGLEQEHDLEQTGMNTQTETQMQSYDHMAVGFVRAKVKVGDTLELAGGGGSVTVRELGYVERV